MEDARFTQVAWALRRTYNVIAALLLKLPTLPLEVPELGESTEDHLASTGQLYRASGLLEQQPMDPELCRMLVGLILEWLTLYEMVAAIEEVGPDELRLELSERLVKRVSLYFEQIYELTGDIEL